MKIFIIKKIIRQSKDNNIKTIVVLKGNSMYIEDYPSYHMLFSHIYKILLMSSLTENLPSKVHSQFSETTEILAHSIFNQIQALICQFLTP